MEHVKDKKRQVLRMSLKYESIISKMTLEEKALMMSGKNTWQTVDFEKYGIPSMTMSDGPHGLRRQAGAGDWRRDRSGTCRGSSHDGCQCHPWTGAEYQEKSIVRT